MNEFNKYLRKLDWSCVGWREIFPGKWITLSAKHKRWKYFEKVERTIAVISKISEASESSKFSWNITTVTTEKASKHLTKYFLSREILKSAFIRTNTFLSDELRLSIEVHFRDGTIDEKKMRRMSESKRKTTRLIGVARISWRRQLHPKVQGTSFQSYHSHLLLTLKLKTLMKVKKAIAIS